ncbi:MAG: toll/interleukin-1 receptor domain-containing protein [Alistipes sp.]|nr:toll/interleukin-1 receptor domain-containing protein [Alistipes sp.]
MKYDIFISYRREGGYDTAKHLNDLLVRDGYKVSFDIDTLRNDNFDTQLLERIEQCKDFILIVDQHAFDRTLDPNFDPNNDWVRQELAHALKHKKNIIPVFLAGVKEFPEHLPIDIVGVKKKNGPQFSKYYFDDFYKKLKSHFLTSRSRKTILLSAIAIIAVICFVLYMLLIKENTITYQNPNMPHPTTQEELDQFAKDDLQRIIEESKYEPNDSTKIVQQWHGESEGQNAISQYSLGLCYYTGYVVETDKEKAIKYFKSAANEGLAQAQFALGICYGHGIEVDPSIHKAIELLRISAEQEFAPAQYNHGIMLFYGKNMNIPKP